MIKILFYPIETIIQLPAFIWSEEYQLELLSRHFKAFDILHSHRWFIGEFIWNFADFKTFQGKVKTKQKNKYLMDQNKFCICKFMQHINEWVEIKKVYSQGVDNQKWQLIMFANVTIR